MIKMKATKILLMSIFAITISCNTLDVPPMNIVGDKEAFSSESGVNSYMARFYWDLPIEDFSSNNGGLKNNPENNAQDYTGETMKCDPRRSDLGGGDFPYWDYTPIRNMNCFLLEFQ